jgi:hypothetical protein
VTDALQDAVDRAAEDSGFAGVVRVDRSGGTELCTAYGLADRAHGVPNTVDTLFATASGAKTLTALAVMCLVERGTLQLGTTARSLLGDDLPLNNAGSCCSHCWPNGRPARTTTTSCALSSASPGAWWTLSSCVRTSSPAAPPGAT